MLKRVRSFLQRLFPPQLQAYIPGKKLVAGGVLYILASAFGIGGDQVVDLPLVGGVTVSEAALGLGVYLFPEKPVEIEAPSSEGTASSSQGHVSVTIAGDGLISNPPPTPGKSTR